VDDYADGGSFAEELGGGAAGILRTGGEDEQRDEQKSEQKSRV
jgi:hypothetical protein